MARTQRSGPSWEAYLPFILLAVGAVIVLALVIGPTGKQKEAIDQIEPQDKSKMDKEGIFKQLDKELAKAKPQGKPWPAVEDEELVSIAKKAHQAMAEKGYKKDVSLEDAERAARALRRKARAAAKEVPSDDPVERWKKRVGKKFKFIRRIDLRDETGFLNCPQVDVWEDAGRTAPAGQMNHDEWVVIVEEEGSMAKVQRRRDKREAWIEAKYLRKIYTEEDIERGPDRKEKERTE